MIKREKRAARNDYDVLSFRLSTDQKGKIMGKIEIIRKRLNRYRPEDEKIINKNDVILEALERGMKSLGDEK